MNEVSTQVLQSRPHLDDVAVADYLYGEMTANERAVIENHLQGCPVCSAMTESLAVAMDGVAEPEITVVDSVESIEGDNPALHALEASGSLEHFGDYELPNGLHASVHVNVAKLCLSELNLRRVATCVSRELFGTEVDVIVASTWPVAMLAKRVARLLPKPVPVIRSEGYHDIKMLGHFRKRAKLLLLFDVIATGRQVSSVIERVTASDGEVVKAICIAQDANANLIDDRIASLVKLDLGLSAEADCGRCGRVPAYEWNPIAACMTVKKLRPRSPSAYLDQNPEAMAFWMLVSQAKAYHPHFVDGDVHYQSFFDTNALLDDSLVGPQVLALVTSALQDQLGAVPSKWVVPARPRSLHFANCLKEHISRCFGRSIDIQLAQEAHGRWTLAGLVAERLQGQEVLIVDNAASYGDTLDELILECERAQVASQASAVIVSRMSDSQEQMFGVRLGNRFVRLHQQTVRPPKVRRKDDCEWCRRNHELLMDADETGLETLVAKASQSRNAWRFLDQPRKPIGPSQLPLPEVAPLLSSCAGAVASGVTLNALFAAMNDGMAPLSLDELSNKQIPVENKTAMVECLPTGVLKWSGEPLVGELNSVIDGDELDDLWVAATGVFAREGHWAWTLKLEERLRVQRPTWNRNSRAKLVDRFYRAVRSNHGLRAEMRGRLSRLIGSVPNAEIKDLASELDRAIDAAERG